MNRKFEELFRPARRGSQAAWACLLLALILLLVQPMAALAGPGSVGGLPHMQTAAPTGRVVVKLAPVSGLVMDSAGLAVRPGARDAAREKARLLKDLVESLVPGARLEKRIPTAEILPLDRARAGGLPDLALYAQLETQGMDRAQLVKLAARLNAHPDIELAFLEPVAVPAALGFDAFTGAVPGPPAEKDLPAPATGDFIGLQGYLGSAPIGIGALPMREVPGQRGAGVTIIDVEGAWLWAHEDLTDPVFDLGLHIDELSWRNHGTAVMGEMRGSDNGLGVVGITPDCSVGNSAIGGSNTAAALAAAVEVLNPGDLILIELHAPGPNANGEYQFGYVPMEYWQDNFDVIRLATSRGIIVCEAAGNGAQNLDGEEYMGLFDRQVRDSGAIMCGATEGSELIAADFSNNGTRVDLNGWGWNVATTGYGDLSGFVEEEYYTQYFSGTSSASPIVTGSVASLQGMVRQLHGFDLDARLARDLLRSTGTEMNGGNLIGTRPNLEEALVLAADIGEISGTVTDLATGLPLSNILVLAGGGSFTLTDAMGHWRLPLLDGPTPLQFSSFFYRPGEIEVDIVSGESLTADFALEPLPRIDINGTVYSEDLTPVAGAHVTCTNLPIEGTISDETGSFTLGGVPVDQTYQLLFDGSPGHGAQLENASVWGFTGPALVNPQLPVVSENFESGPGLFTASAGLWTHGIPPVEVTGGAFDGSLCWGVGMDGDYGDDESDQLLSPVYDLSQVVGTSYQLSFHYYCATEPGFDGVNLEVSDGGAFSILHPLSSYTDQSLGGLANQPGWAGASGRWQGAVFDISAFVGGNFQFRMNWGSDGGVTGQGFYLDGIAFGSGLRVTPVPDQPLPEVAGAMVKAWPNPFNPRVTLEYTLARPGHLQVVVFDVRGRRVKTLLDGDVADTRGSLQWDGMNEAGQQSASGVYFVLASPEQGRPAVSRVVLSK
jgi:hypothetical protein